MVSLDFGPYEVYQLERVVEDPRLYYNYGYFAFLDISNGTWPCWFFGARSVVDAARAKNPILRLCAKRGADNVPGYKGVLERGYAVLTCCIVITQSSELCP